MRINRQVTLNIQIKSTKEFEAALGNLNQLVQDPSILAMALRAAIFESLMLAYQERFPKEPPRMYKIDEDDTADEAAEKEVQGDFMTRIRELSYRRDEAAPRSQERRKLNQQLKRMERLYRLRQEKASQGQIKGDRESEYQLGRLALGGTGRFHSAMRELRYAMLNRTQKGLQGKWGTNQVTVGFGSLEELNAIETPSHNPKHPPQPYGILWRHLEFGTGILAKGNIKGSTGYTQESDGSWWYGPRPGVGVHLKGSKPTNFLRNSTGMHYDSQAVRFSGALTRHLNRVLRGL